MRNNLPSCTTQAGGMINGTRRLIECGAPRRSIAARVAARMSHDDCELFCGGRATTYRPLALASSRTCTWARATSRMSTTCVYHGMNTPGGDFGFAPAMIQATVLEDVTRFVCCGPKAQVKWIVATSTAGTSRANSSVAIRA